MKLRRFARRSPSTRAAGSRATRPFARADDQSADRVLCAADGDGPADAVFGARATWRSALLYAINGGRDEISGDQVGPANPAAQGDVLEFDDVLGKFERMMDWLAGVYVNAMNIIHYMHDKYAYERIEMALHDYNPVRTMAFGIAGMSVVADSLSAIKYARVRVVRDATGLVTDYQTEGTFPTFGNNDNRVDQLAAWLVSTFMSKLRKYPTYRNARHTQSVLTITSNVVCQGARATPDGRRHGEPFAPGANPMHGRDSHGIHAAAASVAKILTATLRMAFP